MKIQKPTICRVVEVVLEKDDGTLTTRPAVIVNCWGNENINVKVLLDDGNDQKLRDPHGLPGSLLGRKAHDGVLWLTSIGYDSTATKARTWRYPPYSKDEIEVADVIVDVVPPDA